ncbi:MAG: tetratricopeptide repeat protein [Alphaproteobacteria bacterium]|nr:tetratricopeptide repeat protein [Alphaproteobacteria bacterium]
MSVLRKAALTVVVLLTLPRPVGAAAEEPATFVGVQACAGCHTAQFDLWKGSHHALAMQPATTATVLGDFADAKLEYFGVTTTFFRNGDKFMVRTEGPDGALHDNPIAYTFGIYPLQQYLIPFPGGRLQALGIAWDSRPKDQGGQRWFHLYPSQQFKPGDPLHWTARDQTWNYQCADCHSTDLKKNYDLAANTYATSWTDLDVACEACHGPGSRHVAWAKAHTGGSSYPSDTDAARMGLTNWLKPSDHGHWEMNPETGIARRAEKLMSTELETCAACHSRRKVLASNPIPGEPYLDSYLPALLDPGLYHADGQIDGEVYEYGSFLQSRMHAAGVTCSNCHDPHSAKLLAAGNALCAQCHLPEKFDMAAHHHHKPGSASAQCVNCHMPTKNYMVVDARRDHSIRVPRPDLSVSLGTPNACSQCHADRPAQWAADTVAGWYPRGRQTTPHYGAALHAGRIGAVDAEQQLDRLILDRSQPAIARASALPLLAPYASPASEPAIKAAIRDPDVLVRMGSPRALPGTPPPRFVDAAAPLLSDPVRAVRIEAARALATTDPAALPPEQQAALVKATAELVAAEMVDADRPEAHLNLGLLHLRRRQLTEAEEEYRAALRLDPNFVPALVNLADLDRAFGRDEEGADLLRKAMAIEPDNADVRYALGLYLVRKHDYPEALDLLRRAHELMPDNARYSYVYAVALNSSGASGEALALLEQTHQRHPADRNVLMALVSIGRDNGDFAEALRHARELLNLDPGNAQLQALIAELEKKTRP